MNQKSLDAVGFDHTRGVGKIDIIPHEKPEVPRIGYYRSVIKLGIIKQSDEKFPSGNISLGTAVQAIEFALKIDDHYDMREFLNGWMHGDVEEWDEYQSFIQEKAA